jgi:hypothetical protein
MDQKQFDARVAELKLCNLSTKEAIAQATQEQRFENEHMRNAQAVAASIATK